MSEAHDFGKERFLTTVRYPPISKFQLPWGEWGVETRETEEPYRRGYGCAWRVPFTRLGVVVGKWIDKGGDEEERLWAAIQGSGLEAETAEIAGWE